MHQPALCYFLLATELVATKSFQKNEACRTKSFDDAPMQEVTLSRGQVHMKQHHGDPAFSPRIDTPHSDPTVGGLPPDKDSSLVFGARLLYRCVESNLACIPAPIDLENNFCPPLEGQYHHGRLSLSLFF